MPTSSPDPTKLVDILPASSGRFAVVARRNKDAPWVQLAAEDSHEKAQEFIDQYAIAYDDRRRVEEIEAAMRSGHDWGDDAVSFPDPSSGP